MSTNIKNKEQERKVNIIVSRRFGFQNFLEIYSDYVAKKIREMVRVKKEDEEKSKK